VGGGVAVGGALVGAVVGEGSGAVGEGCAVGAQPARSRATSKSKAKDFMEFLSLRGWKRISNYV
jgi:hypothetical protein